MVASKTGLDAQIGLVVEATYATAATVTRFYPLVSETMKADIERIESAGIIATRQMMTSQQWAQGNKKVSGDIQMELYDQSMGLLFRAISGTVSTAGTVAPYTHTFVPSTPDVSFTTQIGRPTVYGSVIPFTYTGCKAQSWELNAKAGAIVTFGLNVVAQDEMMGTALASASYTTGLKPWTFVSGTLTIAGVSTPVKAFKAGGALNLAADRFFVGGSTISEPLRQDLLAVTGEITPEWGGPSAQGTLNYLRYIGGTEAALVFTLASGTLSGTITANVRYDGTTPNVGGRGIVEHPIPFKCVASGADSTGITMVLVNNDSVA